ncbi:hypothetical protein DAPPUDRAFT_313849 [Daphnia pulex]|uniref:Uncharacterized protein n=1 Tax=Daphnia pulex TaxID=6669 RepID=E9G5G2_DAPPU|nr:hypothetical protein DAPPUDRAFT_313849 [Daphnia pulex]|eukprot:EFX85199.1 hypothetical protein DAPPUDRAFT_313849 [Daphnia pulex]
MKIHEFDECCCGCSLRTGTKIIGFISMLIEIGVFVLAIIKMKFNFNIDNEIEEMLTNDSIDPIISLGVGMAAAACVVIAAWKDRRPMLLVPWLVLEGSTLPVMIGNSIYFGTLLTIRMGTSTGMAFLAVSLLATAICFYFWLVVFNYYFEMKTSNDMIPDEKSPLMDYEYVDKNLIIV